MSRLRPVAAAFDPGVTPTIAVFNRAKTPLGLKLDALIAAMQEYVDKHVAPVWGTPARLVRSSGFRAGAWAMVFLDNADEPGALAYHDLTPDGLPLAKIFVETTLADHTLVSATASHELVEMLVDPAVDMTVMGADNKTFYAYESADPVEDLSFKVRGIPMSNFVYPAYFESFRKRGSVRFDHLSKVKRPLQILSGGYQSIFRNGRWSEVWGSAAKKKRFKKEDRRGHRSEQRKKEKLRRTSLSEVREAERRR